jgi:hypothetical protein
MATTNKLPYRSVGFPDLLAADRCSDGQSQAGMSVPGSALPCAFASLMWANFAAALVFIGKNSKEK